jgi:molybdopterin-guanine dinucleotide biosynthesis protein B
MRTVAIGGRSGSGKTHLIERLIQHFTVRGLQVATVKHTHHHDFEVDRPGKDSWRHRTAGATETLLVSDRGYALLGDLPDAMDWPDILRRMRPVDLLLIEGFGELRDLPRIEVYRSSLGERPLAADDSRYVAIAVPADDRGESVPGLETFDLDDTAAIGEFILRLPAASATLAARRRGPTTRLAHLHAR